MDVFESMDFFWGWLSHLNNRMFVLGVKPNCCLILCGISVVVNDFSDGEVLTVGVISLVAAVFFSTTGKFCFDEVPI